MGPFDFVTAHTVGQALDAASADSAYLAGGTTFVDLAKLGVVSPDRVIDINPVGLSGIDAAGGGLRVGALERMADVAEHEYVARQFPVIAQALLASASPQIRNMAAIGGNLMQRTRCGYFRDISTACNKRTPGSGCPAQAGDNRGHAILGTSVSCAATHPSDLAVALVALDASVSLTGRSGSRTVPLADFYLLPGDTPQLEHDLRPGELITEVVVPRLAWASKSAYLKVRDRASYEFALASAAVALDVEQGRVRDVRIAVGGVGTKPWRLPTVEAALRGGPATEDAFTKAARLATDGARPLSQNAFKVPLVQRTIVRALIELAAAR